MARVIVKYGTFAEYNALSTKDTNTLYFITDSERGGIIYKGSKLVTENIRVTLSGSGVSEVLTITDYTISNPATYTVSSAAAVSAIKTAIEASISTHRSIGNSVNADGKATNREYGHVQLSDATDGTETEDVGGTAATPKAVSDALAAAKTYADGLVGGLSGAMIFKGTLGRGGTVSNLPTSGYKAGWTYVVKEADTYAGYVCEVGDSIYAINDGPSSGDRVIIEDWTAVQANVNGAVTTTDTLTSDTIVLGNGNRTIKKLAAGTVGYYLQQGSNGPQWVEITNLKFGFAHFTCSTAADTAAKTVSLSGFSPKEGCIFAVRFQYGSNVANATLQINSMAAKPIYRKGSAITATYQINAGEDVTFMYDGTNYNILSIDRLMDSAPAQNSVNLISSGGVYTALQGKQDSLHAGSGILIGTVNAVDNTIHLDYGEILAGNTTKPVTGAAIATAIAEGVLSSILLWETITTQSQS